MKTMTFAALFAFAALGSAAVAQVAPTTTHAQLHTMNNLDKYSKHTTSNLSRYSRNECIRRGGVMIKQASNGQLVCVAKMRK